MIGVVIPYFQRTPGLLNRALRSVAAQAGAGAQAVYVVDDASPAPTGPELDGLPDGFARRVRILPQPNGGPGAARNLALERMDPGLRAVAFLPEQAERLGVKPGDPGLFIERRGFLQDGRAAEFTQSYYRGDAYDVVAELNDIS